MKIFLRQNLASNPTGWHPADDMKAIHRRHFLKSTVAIGSTLTFTPGLLNKARAQDNLLPNPAGNVIPAPKDPAQWQEFRRQLAQWREHQRQALNYSDSLYRRKDFAWVPSSFSCCFLMLCDETFYNPKTGRYTVKNFVEHGRREFGGYDSIVLWQAYPRIGLDDRNQFDFYRDMPGGLKGLRRAIDQLHRQGMRVYIDYNPWDTNTRREKVDDLTALTDMVAALDIDGIFLDTMDRGAEGFRAQLDRARPGVVLEGEGALPLSRIHDHHMSWAQWFGDSEVPGILRNKWFERRHMQHQIRRWDHDHSAELHQAWMNGSGMMVWENVFGAWNGWSERDRAILRSMLPIQRRYTSLFSGEGWVPLVPTSQPGIYANLWQEQGLRLWTLVNRTNQPVSGDLMDVVLEAGEKVYDLVSGIEARRIPKPNGFGIHGTLQPRGIGCIAVATDAALGPDFRAFMKAQNKLQARAKWDTANPVISVSLIPVTATPSYSNPPENMAVIPATMTTLKVEFRTRECACYESNHGQAGPPALHKPIFFERPARLKSYAIDRTLVTNAQFAAFLKASGYKPRHPENFLKHWQPGQKPPPDKLEHPVVYVDLDDARAYARWAGKRLPTEEEWHYAAQGSDQRKYPWGNEFSPARCNGGQTGTTTPVTAFPEGRSPFGLYDMCGNVWQWTESERSDGRTRFAILRGGSFYKRGGSAWYFDEGPQPVTFAAKMLLMWPGLDRCANIGFRCAAELV